MAKRCSRKERAKPISVGIYPSDLPFLQARANVVGSLSRYLRVLAEYDRKHNILAAALKSRFDEEE